jgi:peptidyl-prolyl cis-trans isomerase SurA
MKNALLLLILMAGSLFAQTNEGPVITAIDGYAAQVGSAIITYGKIRENAAPYMQQLAQNYKGEELARQMQKLYMETREALIEEALIKEETRTLGLALPPASIDEEVNRLILERFDNNRALLIQALAARRMTFDEWRAEVADQITLRVYYNREITRHVSISEEQIQAAYDESKKDHFIPLKVKFRAILINKGKTDEDRVVKKQQADTVLQKLRDGADFAEMAKKVSEGIRASDGGAFPWKEPKEVREELRPALRTVSAGQVSDLIETDGEFYIVKMEERREEGYVPLDDLREQIQAALFASEQNRLHAQLIERLTKRHFVIRY